MYALKKSNLTTVWGKIVQDGTSFLRYEFNDFHLIIRACGPWFCARKNWIDELKSNGGAVEG